MALKNLENLAFDGYVIERARWTLRWRDTPIAVSRKTFDLLLYLIDHRDQVAGKEELLAALWPKQVVEESNLAQQIFLLRKALSRHASGAKIIETVAGRGYRFVAAVEEVPASGQDASATTPLPPEHHEVARRTLFTPRRVGVGAGLLIMLLAAAVGWYLW